MGDMRTAMRPCGCCPQAAESEDAVAAYGAQLDAAAPRTEARYPVTDGFHDAPDGAVIEWPDFGPGLWECQGDWWVPLADPLGARRA